MTPVPADAEAALAEARALHVPVMLAEVLEALAPLEGAVFIDGTFGAGGYTRALLEAGAARVIAIDRDPEAVARGRLWAPVYGDRLEIVEGPFGLLDELAGRRVDGVVLDIGVSSMQIDAAGRGFSFMREGPLDMRMGGEGPSAADIVNRADEAEIADILYHYGEERGARRIARRVVAARAEGPIETTAALAALIEGAMGPARKGQIHPATRSFQGLRIAVNDELGELWRGLMAAERALLPGGRLAVVSFHSLEDRIVKRYLQLASGRGPSGSRHGPEIVRAMPRFARPAKDRVAGEAEVAANPRARSARLRAAARLDAPFVELSPAELGVPDAPVAADLFGDGRTGGGRTGGGR